MPGLEGLVGLFTERLGDARSGSPKEFGILEENLAPTLVYDVTNHPVDRHVSNRPTWVTAKGRDSIDWIIGPSGEVSLIGIVWNDAEPILMRHGDMSLHFPLEGQSVYSGIFPVTKECTGRVVAVQQGMDDDNLQIASLLCVQIPQATVSWETIGRYIQGNALVSGVGHVGGPVRDFITRHKRSDSLLLQELKQRSARTR